MDNKGNSGTPGKLDVHALSTGYTFKYGYSTWTILESYEYDWGDECFSREYKVSDGQQVRYLSVEEEDGLELAFYEEVPREEFEKSLPKSLQDGQEMPESLFYNSRGFFFDEECPGYYHNLEEEQSEGEEIITWDYYDKTEKYILSIEQWGEDDFEIYIGETVAEYEIRDIAQG